MKNQKVTHTNTLINGFTMLNIYISLNIGYKKGYEKGKGTHDRRGGKRANFLTFIIIGYGGGDKYKGEYGGKFKNQEKYGLYSQSLSIFFSKGGHHEEYKGDHGYGNKII